MSTPRTGNPRGRPKVLSDFVKIHYSCCPDKYRWVSRSEYYRYVKALAEGTYRCKSCAGKARARHEQSLQSEKPEKPVRGTKHINIPPHTATYPTGDICLPPFLSNPPSIVAHSCFLTPAYGPAFPEQPDPEETELLWPRELPSCRCEFWESCWWGAHAADRNDPASCLNIVGNTVWPGWKAQLREGATILTLRDACPYPKPPFTVWNALLESFDDYAASSCGYFQEVIHAYYW